MSTQAATGSLARPLRPAPGRLAAGPVRRLARLVRDHPVLVVLVAVVVANLPYLLGVVDPNPMLTTANLPLAKGERLLPGRNYIDPNIGVTAQAFGHLAAEDWLHLHIPWWNPYEGIGAPLAGEMQSAAFFVPLVLLDALPNGQILFRIVLEVVAGVSTYYLLIRFVTSRAIALAGGIAFALNGTFSWMFHAPANPVAFAPMALLGIEQCLDRDSRGLRGWLLVALAFALSIYAGFPEVAYIDGVLCAVWLLARCVEIRSRILLPALSRVAAGGVLAGLLAAPILVAFLTYLPHADVAGHNGAYGRAFISSAFELPSLVTPYVFGPIFGWVSYDHSGLIGGSWSNVGGYLGLAVVFLACVALLGRPHRPLRIALAVWVVVGVARTDGWHPAMDLINAIPAMSNTAFYRYGNPSWSLAMVVLAAFGMQDLARKRQPAKTALAVVVAAGLMAFFDHYAFDLLRRVRGAPHNQAWAFASVGFAALVLLACLAGSLLRSRRGRIGVLAAAVACEALAFFVVPQFSAVLPTTMDLGPVTWLQAHLGNQRFYTLGPIAPGYGSYWDLPEAAVNDIPTPKAYASYITSHLDTNVDPVVFTGTTMASKTGPTPAQELIANLAYYEAIGVEYVAVPRGQSLPHLPGGASLQVVYRDSKEQILRLPHPAPLFSPSATGCRLAGPGTVDSVTVTCDRSATLTYRELYLSGDSATDDGRGVHVVEEDGLFQSVRLHAGKNSLRFSYAPPHADLAGLALLVGLVAIAIKAVLGLYDHRRASPRPSPG